MSRTSYGMALTLGLMLILSDGDPAQSGMMGQGQMGPSEGGDRSITWRDDGWG